MCRPLMRRPLTVVLGVLLLALATVQPCSAAQPDSLDLLTVAAPDSIGRSHILDRVSETPFFQKTYIGVPLIAGGLIVMHEDRKFRKLRNDFMPQFHRPFDNYTQYVPAAVMYGMKVAGVKSRSSWSRMLVSQAFSAALMATTVQGLKHTTSVYRPDGADNHSFPSGHTAMAFMTATMLSKEYGYKSPWVSIGAYGLAATTGLMRVANNKHWLSDVMVGAGVGILTTEMGYWLADLLFKDKGLVVPDPALTNAASYRRNPSFVGLYVGFNLPMSHYDIDEHTTFKTSTGTTLGLEGAGFFNPYIGIGGRATISNLQYILNDTEAPDNTCKSYMAAVGPYFSLPLTHRWRVGSKLLAGGVWYPDTQIGTLTVHKNHGLAAGTGLNIDYQARAHLVGSIFLDYNILAPHSRFSGEYMHTMTLGAKVVMRL